jgi:hypothetical protein
MMRKYDDKSRVTLAIGYLVRRKCLKRYCVSKVMKKEDASGAKTRRKNSLDEVKR